MATKKIQAEISRKFSKYACFLLFCWIGIFAVFTILGFTLFNYTYANETALYWYSMPYGIIVLSKPAIDLNARTGIFYDAGLLCLVIFLNIFIFSCPPTIYLLINRRKRKLTELTVNEREIVGSYTGFVPISKITLKMPIEKIDNIAAVKNFFFLYTGKALRIASASGVIKIPYVVNADEIVDFISDSIERTKSRPAKSYIERENSLSDVVDVIKKFAELRDAGIITEEEFNQKKRELLENS